MLSEFIGIGFLRLLGAGECMWGDLHRRQWPSWECWQRFLTRFLSREHSLKCLLYSYVQSLAVDLTTGVKTELHYITNLRAICFLT